MRKVRTIPMRIIPHLAALGLVIAAWTIPAEAGIRVRFADRAHFTDAGGAGASALGAIKSHLERLGGRLDRGFDLTIVVLDVDLAGQDEDFRNRSSVRVMRRATSPKIKLRYVLTQGRRAVASGEEWVTDPNYQMRIDTATSSDPQRYEKAMLADWFRSRFGSHLRTGG